MKPIAEIAASNEAFGLLVLAERGAVAAAIARAHLDDSAGEELVPHQPTVPGHDINAGGGL